MTFGNMWLDAFFGCFIGIMGIIPIVTLIYVLEGEHGD